MESLTDVMKYYRTGMKKFADLYEGIVIGAGTGIMTGGGGSLTLLFVDLSIAIGTAHLEAFRNEIANLDGGTEFLSAYDDLQVALLAFAVVSGGVNAAQYAKSSAKVAELTTKLQTALTNLKAKNAQSYEKIISQWQKLNGILAQKAAVVSAGSKKNFDAYVAKIKEIGSNFGDAKVVSGAGSVLRKIDDFIPSSGTKLIGNTNKTTTLLGRWIPDMQVIKDKMLPNEFNVGTKFGTNTNNNGGFNFLNIPDELANASADFFNQYNKPWLQQAIQRGDDIVLATRPINKSDFITSTAQLKGMYAKELEFLVQQDYKPINLSPTEWNTIKTWFP
jgi:hypothetical protein